jgi:heme exporter protein D
VNALAGFFDMGGYGIYVWPAYALAAIVMIGLMVASLRTLHVREASLQALEDDRPAGSDGTGRESCG